MEHLTLREFKTSADIIDLFQEQLDRFPIDSATGNRRFTEFGGYMIRPRGVKVQRLTHFVFPSTVVGIPDGGKSLQGFSDISYPLAYFLICEKTGELWVSVSSHDVTEDKLAKRTCLIAGPDQFVLNASVWEYFAATDQNYLITKGLMPNCSAEQLADFIRNEFSWCVDKYLVEDRERIFFQLPIAVNSLGSFGTLNSFCQSSKFVTSVLSENQLEWDGIFVVGSAHIHPKNEYSGVTEQIVNRIGEHKAQMTLSPADIRVLLSCIDAYNTISRQITGEDKRTAEAFVSILGVNETGQITGIQHHDVSLIDEMDELEDLNERTLQTFGSSNPDIGLIAAHYEFLNNPEFCSIDFPSGEIGDYVGTI